MTLALCTHFLDGGIWRERLWEAALCQKGAGECHLEIDEYGTVGELLGSRQHYDGIVVALKGVAGLQAVRELWERGFRKPLIWIADEDDYGSFAWRYQVAFFLEDTQYQAALPVALERVREAVNARHLVV